MESLLLPRMTLLTPAPFPGVRELRAARGARCQLVVVQPPAAKGPDARRALPPRWELSLLLCSLGVNSTLRRETSSAPALGRPPPSLSQHSQLGSLVVGAEGGWGCPAGEEPLPLPELSASSPACPAVWPCFASRLLPVLPLTDIVSVGIYISLTTLSPNGIKSKAGDK